MEQKDRPAVASPRSSKRPRASAPASPAEKKLRLSPNNGSMRDETLRIVAEALRVENQELLQDIAVLQDEKRAADERLAQSQRIHRVLLDDVARVYGQKQKETQRQELEQKLQDHTRILGRPAGRGESKDIDTSVLLDTRTTQEMDRFLQSCERWQTRLGQLSGQLKDRVDRMETQEVSSVLQDLVARVEVDTLQKQVQALQDQLLLAVWLKADVASCLQDVTRCRQETEEFEAVEKQLLDDRVVELETQLAQKRAVEREKEMELSSLRAAQEELLQFSHVVPIDQFEALAAEKKAVDVELRLLKENMMLQREEFGRREEERTSLKQHNLKLLEETRHSREKHETNEFESVQQSMSQEAEIKKLQAQLQAREAKMAAVLKGAEKQIAKGRQWKEELQILYTKFSSSMDSVSEKAMRLEELEQELKDAKSIVQVMQVQKAKIENQVAQLQEKLDLSTEQDNVNDELAKVQGQYSELKVLESQQKELAGKMRSEMAELRAQNEALREQRVKKEHQSVGQPSNERDKQSSAGADNALAIQTAEKEALQMFVQRYYSAAEDKCRKLLEKISELEAQKTSAQEQTKESCSVLHMCTQIESCDESIRASLLDVMATLECLT